MTDQPGPLPQRIGDAERDQAVEYLRDHLAEGRLNTEEFDERLTRALQARTQADLDPLFLDLPAPKPGRAVDPTPIPAPVPAAVTVQTPYGPMVRRSVAAPPSRGGTALAVLSSIAWPAAFVLLIASHWQFWWVMMIPFFISMAAGQHGSRHRRR